METTDKCRALRHGQLYNEKNNLSQFLFLELDIKKYSDSTF